MRPMVWTYCLVIAVPDAGPGTSAAFFGSGTCCAYAVVNASAPTSAAARRICLRVVFMVVTFLSFIGCSARRRADDGRRRVGGFFPLLMAGFGPPDLLLVFRTERGVAQPDDDAVEAARELERHVVVLADRRAGVLTDIQRFIDRDAERDGALDPALGDLLVVHRQRGRAAFADAAAVILEVKQDDMLAGRELVRAGDRGTGDAGEVVVEHRLAPEQGEADAIEASALGHYHSFRPSRAN